MIKPSLSLVLPFVYLCASGRVVELVGDAQVALVEAHGLIGLPQRLVGRAQVGERPRRPLEVTAVLYELSFIN